MQKRKKNGYSQSEACEVLNRLIERSRPPFQLMAYGKLTDKLKNYTGLQTMGDGFDSVQAVYEIFRQVRPHGRWSMCVVDSGNAALVLDTQIIEKALALDIQT